MFIKKFKWMIGASMMLVVLASVTIAHGGGRWSGIDPELRVNNDKINIWVEWPTEMTCELDRLDVQVLVPLFSRTRLVAESAEQFTCDNGETVTLQTDTKIIRASVAVANVSARVTSSAGIFPVKLKVSKNDGEIRECTGLSNVLIECLPFSASKSKLINRLLFF